MKLIFFNKNKIHCINSSKGIFIFYDLLYKTYRPICPALLIYIGQFVLYQDSMYLNGFSGIYCNHDMQNKLKSRQKSNLFDIEFNISGLFTKNIK